ncbi:MAG TPA: glycosyltransferase family 2 protein [Candidatus Eisenbacteria bacterium]|nr:glycosyltransferase family 2 protein [Candidatus Eisenbacteria bacterium]
MGTAEPRPSLSIVVPVYNEEGNVGPLHAELSAVARQIGRPYEIVFVNDGSTDQTLPRLVALTRADPALRVVELDGNFGEAAALSAGFDAARGDVVATLDGDGQNDPAAIPFLLEKLEEGYDAASGRRLRRREAFTTRVLPSLVANRAIALATGVPVYDCGCGLKAYRRHLVEGAQLPRGFNRFLPAILGVDPKRVAEITVRDRPRGSGASHYGLSRLFIVLRDLPALPLLTRFRRPPQAVVRALGRTIAAVYALVVVGALTGHTWLALAALGAQLNLIAARDGVARMALAREKGVFRVRKVHHGGTSGASRHRGTGVLGQEPAPYLQ